MNATECIFRCRELGITLRVTDDDNVGYRPESRMTPELLEAMGAVKGEIVRDLLLADALEYLASKYVPGANLDVLDAPGDDLDAAYDKDMPEFRAALREYCRAGVREFKRAGRSVA